MTREKRRKKNQTLPRSPARTEAFRIYHYDSAVSRDAVFLCLQTSIDNDDARQAGMTNKPDRSFYRDRRLSSSNAANTAAGCSFASWRSGADTVWCLAASNG